MTDEALPVLGELELAVLEHLWTEQESDVASTHARVGKPRDITLNTVGSALERLHRKGLVERWKVSHAFRYRASIDRESFHARRMVEAAGGASALANTGLLAAFLDAVAEADASTLDRLEEALKQRKGD
ncbi:MAG: BlaI/MecI/CopY family transcriptional regulator [Sandaracinaceae bacterium]|nr:MAG: BlaI/MecI/CopY family transcriptional regulator [Sandaracinaceae bacterium]